MHKVPLMRRSRLEPPSERPTLNSQNMVKTKVAIYARVSLEEKDKESRRFQDPENQLKPLRDFCKSFDYEIVKEYIDKMSGANPARPSFREMLKDAMLRRFSGIITWKLDRFSREGIIPTMSYIQKLKSRGIWLKSMTESWLDTSQEGITEIVLAIMAWASAEERKKISERTKAGIARLKAQGKWKGGRPKKKGGAKFTKAEVPDKKGTFN